MKPKTYNKKDIQSFAVPHRVTTQDLIGACIQNRLKILRKLIHETDEKKVYFLTGKLCHINEVQKDLEGCKK